jgi:hypothetical protein
MTSSAAMTDSCHVHSLSPLSASDQVQGAGYSEFEVKTDASTLKLEASTTALELEMDVTTLELEMNVSALKLETDTTALDLEIGIDVPQEILKQERYSAD